MDLNHSPWMNATMDILAGHPVVTGTRVPVWVLKGHAANGMPWEQLAFAYNLTMAQIREVLRVAEPFTLTELGAPIEE